MQAEFMTLQRLLRTTSVAGVAACALPVCAAGADGAPDPAWNLVMLLIVLLTAAGSAVLPVSALRYWQGYWKLVAALPLAILAIWSTWIALSKLLLPASHGLWIFEIFAWAMLTMLYMATAFTAKRQFEKADGAGDQARAHTPRQASKPPSRL